MSTLPDSSLDLAWNSGIFSGSNMESEGDKVERKLEDVGFIKFQECFSPEIDLEQDIA